MPDAHDVSRLPSWALSMTAATQEWLLGLSDDVLADPRLWVVLNRYLGEMQTPMMLAHITADVRSMRP